MSLVTLINSTCAASASPLVCTTTYNSAESGTVLETSVCRQIATQNEYIEEEIYTWRAPYSSGIKVLPGIAGNLGLALGGINGNNLVGIGYPEQAIVWDAEILQNKVQALLELQTESVPLRTADLPSGFEGSLADTRIE